MQDSPPIRSGEHGTLMPHRARARSYENLPAAARCSARRIDAHVARRRPSDRSCRTK